MDITFSAYPHIYVINLASSEARRNSITRTMPSNLSYSFFNAIEGKEFPNGCQVGSLIIGRNGELGNLTDGEFGCFASHLALMRRLVDSDQQQIIILEDDVAIPKNFDWALAIALEKAPTDYDMIYLSYNTDMHINVTWPGLGDLNLIHDNKDISREALVDIEPILLGLNRVWGLPAYVISKAGAKKILDSFSQVKDVYQFQLPNGFGGASNLQLTNTNAIDLHILANIHRLKALVTWPMIVFPNMDQSTSVIGSQRSYI